MHAILNIIWLVLCGFWLAVGYVVAGVIMCILIITIPFGIASFRLAAFTLWPFGRTLVPKPDAGAGSLVGNVLWFLLAGLWMAIAHVVTGVLLCLTIIGIPLGIADFKLAAVAIAPWARTSSRPTIPGPSTAPERHRPGGSPCRHRQLVRVPPEEGDCLAEGEPVGHAGHVGNRGPHRAGLTAGEAVAVLPS